MISVSSALVKLTGLRPPLHSPTRNKPFGSFTFALPSAALHYAQRRQSDTITSHSVAERPPNERQIFLESKVRSKHHLLPKNSPKALEVTWRIEPSH
jgi:hypothetical protein